MTRANRRACREWSKSSSERSGKLAGYCELCESRTVSKGNGIFVCINCGLEQPFHPTK